MADWNIRPRSTQCYHCKKEFKVGDKGHSLLVPTEESFDRQDFCETCFSSKEIVTPSLRSGAWTFVIPQHKQNSTVATPVQHETAEHLLRTLLKRNRKEDCDIIYILSILLERKKQLIERRTAVDDEGRRVRIYEQRGTGDIFNIVDPNIQPIEIPTVQRRIIALLEGPPLEESNIQTAYVRRRTRNYWSTRPGVKRKRKAI